MNLKFMRLLILIFYSIGTLKYSILIQCFQQKKSVYDFDIEIHDLSANTSEVTKAFDTVEEQYTAKTLKKAVKGWGNV